MSVIGTITVHKCDDCGKIAVVHTDEDIASFESNWYSGITVDFCPDCESKPANQRQHDRRVAVAKEGAHA